MDPFPTVSIKLLRSAVLWTLSRHLHRTADLSSFMDTFVHNGEVSIELRTSAVLWEYFKTADLSSSMDTFLSSLAAWTDIVKSIWKQCHLLQYEYRFPKEFFNAYCHKVALSLTDSPHHPPWTIWINTLMNKNVWIALQLSWKRF